MTFAASEKSMRTQLLQGALRIWRTLFWGNRTTHFITVAPSTNLLSPSLKNFLTGSKLFNLNRRWFVVDQKPSKSSRTVMKDSTLKSMFSFHFERLALERPTKFQCQKENLKLIILSMQIQKLSWASFRCMSSGRRILKGPLGVHLNWRSLRLRSHL